MSEDHGSLMRMLDEIRAMEPRFEPQTLGIPSAPHQQRAAEELRQLIAHLAAELRDHLNEEERFFTPVIKAYFTKKEHQEVSRGAVSCFESTLRAKSGSAWVY
jgi:hemerythrin